MVDHMVTTTGGRKKITRKSYNTKLGKNYFALIFRVLQILCKGTDLFCFIYVIKLMNERGRSFKQVRLYAKNCTTTTTPTHQRQQCQQTSPIPPTHTSLFCFLC